MNVKKPDLLGLPALSGEVDVIAGRADCDVLWLLEIKDPVDTHAVPEIRRHLDRFFDDNNGLSYEAQLLRKSADLSPFAAEVSAALRLDPLPGTARVVMPMFVTRRPVPAAHVTSKSRFCCITQLLDRMSPI